MIEIVITGNPKQQERARHATNMQWKCTKCQRIWYYFKKPEQCKICGNPDIRFTGKKFTTTRDPKDSREWKQEVRQAARDTLADLGITELITKVPLFVIMLFIFQKPSSKSKKIIYKDTQPDNSNLVKLLEDGLEGVVFDNDSRIVDMRPVKFFAGMLEGYPSTPQTIIRVYTDITEYIRDNLILFQQQLKAAKDVSQLGVKVKTEIENQLNLI